MFLLYWAQKTKQSNDKLNLSSTWDQPPTAVSKQKGSLSELNNLTPQQFSNTEDLKSSDWSKTTPKNEEVGVFVPLAC